MKRSIIFINKKDASYKVSPIEMLGAVSKITLGRGGKYLESLQKTFKRTYWPPLKDN